MVVPIPHKNLVPGSSPGALTTTNTLGITDEKSSLKYNQKNS